MDQHIEAILINTYNADLTLRSQAEEQLNQFIKTRGALLYLIQYSGNQGVVRDLRLAAGIVVKNNLRITWESTQNESAESLLSDQDKESIKTKIIQMLLIETENSIRRIQCEVIRIICDYDYPNKWSTLMPTLIENIHTAGTNILQMYNSLLAIRKIIKKFEYKQNEGIGKDVPSPRQPLNDIVQAVFPLLQQLMTSIIDNNSIEAAQVMRICLKIFHSATMYALPKVQGVDVNFWFTCISSIIQKKLPEASEGLEPVGQPESPDERKTWPWWKLKKWASRILALFIQRYGNPRFSGEEYLEFAKFFKEHVAPVMLAPVMNTLAEKSNGRYVTDEVYRNSITYLSSCAEMSPSYKVIKPHLDFVLFKVIFPTLCINGSEIELFNEDPQEFIRKVHDPLEDYLDPRVTAIGLLQTLCRYRQKDSLPMILPFVHETLTTYNTSSDSEKNYYAKDGVMVTISSLTTILRGHETYKNNLEPFIISHIIPEFQSSYDFLRYRACWCIEYFTEEEWGNPVTLQAIISGLLAGLKDPSLIVQASAAASLKHVITSNGATDILRPQIPQILTEYFRIIDETESDSVLGALCTIVEQFGEDIHPMAEAMVVHLVRAFSTFSSSGNEDDEAAFAASSCLETITTVLDSVMEKPEIMGSIECHLLPLLSKIIASGDECYEYIDQCIGMLNYFTYYGISTISPGVWSMCGPLLTALDDWATDYLKDIMVPLLNYMSKDMATFLTGTVADGTPFVPFLLRIIEKTIKGESYDYDIETDEKSVVTLLTCLIQSTVVSQSINPFLSSIYNLIMVGLAKAKSKDLRVKLLEAGMAMIQYNSPLMFQLFCSNIEESDLFFNTLFSNLKYMDKISSQRLIVLSFSSILELDFSLLTPLVRSNLPNIFEQIIKELQLIEEEEEDECDIVGDKSINTDRNNYQTNDVMRKAAALQIPEGGYEEDEDVVNAEDEEYLQYINELRNTNNDDMYDDDDDDDAYDYTSPTDTIDILKYFLQCMNSSSQKNPEVVLALQNNLKDDVKSSLNNLVQNASSR
jgi:hypothetical protein